MTLADSDALIAARLQATTADDILEALSRIEYANAHEGEVCPLDLIATTDRIMDWQIATNETSVAETPELVEFLEFEHARWVQTLPTPQHQTRHPCAALVRAWQNQPAPVERNTRPDRIFPSRLAMVDGTQAAHDAQRKNPLFMPARHVHGPHQLTLPGFGKNSIEGPALPLALYDLGLGRDEAARRRPAAPLALRLWIEAILSASGQTVPDDNPILMRLTLRQLLQQLYPGDRRPRPVEYWRPLTDAAEALSSNRARIPWENPVTGQGGLRTIVSVSDIPRGPYALDDLVSLTVHLPPGSGPGPILSPRLAEIGAHSAPKYRALINLAFHWFKPGQTRIPVGRKKQYWIQSQRASDYPLLSDDDLIRLCYPTAALDHRHKLLTRARKTIASLVEKGLAQNVDGRILPPPLTTETTETTAKTTAKTTAETAAETAETD